MHTNLLKVATHEQLKEFVDDALKMLKETNYDLYETLETYLYKEVYQCHFCDWLLEKAVSKMVNEDGTVGPHWTVEQTSTVAKAKGLLFSEFNEYDFNYVMNMIYSDYYGAVRDDIDTYYEMSIKFLNDKDFGKGKAFKYYLLVKENNR